LNAPGAAASRVKRRELAIGLVCAAGVLAIWTGFILLTRLVAATTLPPAELAMLRFVVAGAVSAPWVLRHGLGGLGLGRAVFLAVFAGLGFTLFAYTGFRFAPASHAGALMTGTLPLWTVVLAWPVLGERLTGFKLAGIALTLTGVAVIALPALAAGGDTVLGDACFPLASLCWAIYTVAAKRWRVGALQAAFVVYAIAALIYLPPYFVLTGARMPTAPLAEIVFQAIYQGLFATVISLFLYMRAVAALGAGPTTMLTAAVPGLAAVAAIPLLGEWPGPATTAGVVLVTAGVAVTVLALTRPAPAGYRLTSRESGA
jgi:drug/metabolite transporter (DMT)-like permease